MAFIRRHLSFAIKFSISAGILGYLGYKTDWHKLYGYMLHADKSLLVASFLFFGPIMFLGTWRWQILLKVQKINLSFRELFQLFFIGLFFNAFLLGTTGGDVIKIFYATKLVPDKKAAVGLSVIVDRIVGLFALLIVGITLILMEYSFLTQTPQSRLAVWSVLFVAFGGVGGILFSFAIPSLRATALGKRLWDKFPFQEIWEKMYEAWQRYANARFAIIKAFGVSFLVHCCSFMMSYYVARALHMDVPLLPFLGILPIWGCLVAIPISLSGFGVRESLAALLLGLLKIDQEQAYAFSLIVYAVGLVWSLVGGIVYLRYRGPEKVVVS